MKSTWFKLMWRFWPGLLSLLVTFLMLSWWMEPRPRTVASFPFDSTSCSLRHAISPDGNYLASLATGIFSGHGSYISRFALHEIRLQREVFSLAEYINDFRFAADGTLAYLVAKRHRGADKKDILELHRWRPDTKQSQIIWKHESINPRSLYREIDPVTQVAFVDCQLSPDTQTILLTTYEKDTIRGQLIDGYTGAVRITFNIRPNQPQELLLAEVRVMFASDSKSIVVQTCDVIGMDKHYYWHGVDVPSGQVQQAIKLPDGLVTPEFLFVTSSSPISQATNRQGDHLLVTSNNNQIQVIELDELKPPQSEKTQPKIETRILSTHLMSEQAYIAYCWVHFRVFGNGTYKYLPGYPWALRDAGTGKLLHTSRLNSPSEAEKSFYYYLVTALPGSTLVFMQAATTDDKKGSFFEEYLIKLRNWFGIHLEKTGKLLFINGTTGQLEKHLQLPHGQTSIFLSADGKSLNVLSGFDHRIELRTYDYPLRQPWLLIWSWAIGVALMITLLTELRRRRKHRMDAKILALRGSV